MRLAAPTLGMVIISGLRLFYHQGTPFCPWEHAQPESILLIAWSQSRVKSSPGSWEVFPRAADVHKDSNTLLTQRCFPEAESSLFYRYHRMLSLILLHVTGTRMIIS